MYDVDVIEDQNLEGYYVVLTRNHGVSKQNRKKFGKVLLKIVKITLFVSYYYRLRKDWLYFPYPA